MLATAERVRTHNIWSRNIFPVDMEGCVLYLPLWQEDMQGTPILSYDQHHHSCAVAVPTWGVNGRLFDGTDDLITVAEAASITNFWDGGGTAIVWLNASSDGEADAGHILRKLGGSGGWLIYVTTQVGNDMQVALSYQHATTEGVWKTSSKVVTINTWYMFTVTYNPDDNANNPIFYLNLTAYAIGSGLSETTTPDGARKDDSGADLIVGNNSGTSRTWDGYLGEVALFDRIFTIAEITHYCEVTKWRYQ